MAEKRGLIVIMADPPADKEHEWNAWYDATHIPARMPIPGFLFARRFVTAGEGPKYLTLYDLANADVISSEAYMQLRDRERALQPESFEHITPTLPRFSRGIYTQVFPDDATYAPPSTGFVFVLGHDVPAGREDTFNAWYNTEHIPAMKRVPGFVTARRFRARQGALPPRAGVSASGPEYVTVYDIESEEVLQSPEFFVERDSPWSAWVRSWYSRRLRGVYRRIYAFHESGSKD
jgi:hypothetical protein